MVNWILRKFNEKDFEQFLEWRQVVARREKTQEYIDWEYKNGPWGPAETWVADDNGKIVGQYSTQRYEAFYLGEKMIASSSFDTGAHPEYFHPKKNIFQALGNKFFEEEAKQNIHFSTGFPNQYFLFGGVRFGWKIVSPIPLLEIDNLSNLMVEESTKYEIAQIHEFDNDFNGFSEKFKDDIPIYLNRTQKYLNWRFVEKPSLKNPKHQYHYLKYKILDKTGELISYIVTKNYPSEKGKTLQLMDFLIPNEEQIYSSILSFLIKEAKKENKSIEEVLVDRNLISDDDLGRLIAEELDLPFVNLEKEGMSSVYEVVVVTADGTFEVEIDADNGKVLDVEPDDGSEDDDDQDDDNEDGDEQDRQRGGDRIGGSGCHGSFTSFRGHEGMGLRGPRMTLSSLRIYEFGRR